MTDDMLAPRPHQRRKARATNVEVRQRRIEQFALERARWDTSSAIGVIQSFVRQAAVFPRSTRVLNPGGPFA